ncbi:MAG: hypothetical protein A2W01_00790 [Candidatus Solincola sediminis]|uniref:HD domain-containing protein n=1 Tax=Candidatus Solincola sediminis TaxID=1797199 RepID=A0A1F2WR55_9ACTN|nr:MAG: hypothetical protein A2Y75_10770 [Candidatus Solincola sediminis]OFW61123.1 MAG: hypothetical protein A2W01_00790 [Candidatus Solincola sediminis]
MQAEYLEAKKLSQRIAAAIAPPLFYAEKLDEVEASRKLFDANPIVQAGLEIIERRGDLLGHGLSHASKVAIDAGALVIIEMDGVAADENLESLLLLAQLAGIFHDIRRDEADHARKGAEEAMEILKGFNLDAGAREAVANAIRNHEAFRPTGRCHDPRQQLLSDALYDADKFRWGPDNFTETVWSMVARSSVPLSALMDHFTPAMKGIERINETFRTETGKRYGPDFIDRGLEIGTRLYSELNREREKGR